jgi:hypothetical protein
VFSSLGPPQRQVRTMALFDNRWCMKSTSLNPPENDENLPPWIK